MMPGSTPPAAMPQPLSRRNATWLLAGGLAAAASLSALALDKPRQAVVLTIGGNIGERNRDKVAALDMNMLRALPQVSFTTPTPWDKKPQKFTGPLLRDVLALVRAEGRTLKAHAINDYRIEIPASDAQRFDVVLAHSIDDQPLTVRTKGPLFVVYPFHRHPELQNNTYYERSIWQLKHIEVD
jgi:hypothetical protein